MREIIVNGKFLSQKITGVQRFAIEVLRELSKDKRFEIIVAMPKNAVMPEGQFPNCRFIFVGKLTGTKWEQWSLAHFCRKKRLPLLCLGNLSPLFYKKTYLVLHDATFKEKAFFNDAAWSRKYGLFIGRSIKRIKSLYTVSEFSRSRIKHFYPKCPDPIVLGSGYEHVDRIAEEPIEGLPQNFFLSVGSVNGNKNFRYVLELAKKDPSLSFVIVGKKNVCFDEFIWENKIENCFFTGYVTDGQVKWLYRHCRGFILSSFYEGFGLPPLEAAAAGCRRLYLSDIPVFREIYEGCAVFFDPYNYETQVGLTAETDIDEKNFIRLLEKYTWKNAAIKLGDTITADE